MPSHQLNVQASMTTEDFLMYSFVYKCTFSSSQLLHLSRDSTIVTYPNAGVQQTQCLGLPGHHSNQRAFSRRSSLQKKLFKKNPDRAEIAYLVHSSNVYPLAEPRELLDVLPATFVVQTYLQVPIRPRD